MTAEKDAEINRLKRSVEYWIKMWSLEETRAIEAEIALTTCSGSLARAHFRRWKGPSHSTAVLMDVKPCPTQKP